MRVSELVHYHRAGRMEVLSAVFPGAVSTMRLGWHVLHGSAHVLPGAVYVAVPGVSGWPQILRRMRVGVQDGVSGPRHSALAHSSVGHLPRSPCQTRWKEWQDRICFRVVLGIGMSGSD